MQKIWKFAAVLGLSVCTLSLPAGAQIGVPLEPTLLQWTWWITKFKGKAETGETPTFAMDDDHQSIRGKTACGSDWWADVDLDFPKIKIDNVQGTAYDCPASKEVTKFLTLLESADRFHTGPNGLELLDANGRRIMLMVAGG